MIALISSVIYWITCAAVCALLCWVSYVSIQQRQEDKRNFNN
jgi:hypothetical protein